MLLSTARSQGRETSNLWREGADQTSSLRTDVEVYLRPTTVRTNGKTYTYWRCCVVQPDNAQAALLERLGLRLPKRLWVPQAPAEL